MLRVIIVFSVILVAAANSFGQIDWIEHPITTDYNGAWGIYPIDMDGDEDIDLVTTGFEANEITWWENDGAQHFLEHNIDDNLNRAAGVHAGDLDGDGDMDIIGTAYAGHEIAWYENDGQMSFTKYLLVQNYSYPLYARMHDVDGDNDMDIVTCSLDGGVISWWENTGYPNFSRHDIDNTLGGCRQLDVSNLDNDNDIDILAVGQGIGQIAWYENDGNQVFQKHVVVDSYYAFWAQSYDFDDDNDWDILGCDAENYDISWFENDGSMNFSRHIIDNNVGQPYSVKAADLDLDGDLDVISANATSNDVAYWINNGNGSFTKYVACGFSYPVSVYPIDLDLDSDIDIIASAFGNDKCSWLENCYFSIPAFVAGTVSDEWETPVEGVYVYDRDTTDGDYTNIYGQYDLELYDGYFDIIFQKDGYYDTTAYNVSATTGDTTTLDISLISVQIPCVSCVRGIVENIEPAIIESVYVLASGTSVEDYTDFLGRYSLEGLAPGLYDIFVDHQLYRDTTITDVFVTNDSATTLNLTLEGNGAITGFVGDSVSQPISDAIVEIPDLLLYDTTDISGEYLITGIIPGINHDVWFWHFNHMGDIINDVVVAINETLVLDSVYLQPIEHEVIVWYGNPDLSPIEAPIGDTVYVDLYVQTAPYLNISFLHLPLGTDDQYIVAHYTGILYYPLTDWDDISFRPPNYLSPGWHSQSLVGWNDLGGDPNPYLRCPGPIRIASYALEVVYDSSLVGDTVDCFMEGYQPVNGAPLFMDSTYVNAFIPHQFFSSLYFVEPVVGGCEYVVGDANNSGDFNGLDVTFGVNFFKGGPAPQYECECTPGNTWFVAGDVNGSCSYNGLDVTYSVAYFKGGPDPIPCADCPPVE